MPTLATEIKTTAIGDLINFFSKKKSHSIHSNRRNPRVKLDYIVKTTDGDSIKIDDYNYKYVTISKSYVKDKFDIDIGDNQISHLEKVDDIDSKKNLYYITNWRELSSSNKIYEFLKRMLWERKCE